MFVNRIILKYISIIFDQTSFFINTKSKGLITDNSELLLYLGGKLRITVLGGIKLTGFNRLQPH